MPARISPNFALPGWPVMPDLFFERHVPHLPERMFQLVNALEDYPRFLRNVSGMDVKRDAGTPGDVRFA